MSILFITFHYRLCLVLRAYWGHRPLIDTDKKPLLSFNLGKDGHFGIKYVIFGRRQPKLAFLKIMPFCADATVHNAITVLIRCQMTQSIRSEWVNLAMGSILIWELHDVFQCEYLAFYLPEMFKGTLCRKITFYILFNNYIIIFWRMSLIIYEKKSMKIMLTRLGIFNLTLSYQLSGKNYLKVRLTTQQLFFSHFKYSL